MKLKDLQDKHKGELVFVVGGSPSAYYWDSDLIKDYAVFAVNSGIVKVPNAQYFVTDDRGVASWSYFRDLSKLNTINLLYESKLKDYVSHLPKDRTIFFQHTWWFSPSDNKYNLDGLKLNRDITKPIIGARISTASGVALLFGMGAKTIVLLGNDCCLYKDKKTQKDIRYFWEFMPKEKHPYRIKGHPFINKTKLLGFSKIDFVSYWNYFAKVNDDIIGKEVEIIDASEFSALNCFPKMSLEQVLKKYGKNGE